MRKEEYEMIKKVANFFGTGFLIGLASKSFGMTDYIGSKNEEAALYLYPLFYVVTKAIAVLEKPKNLDKDEGVTNGFGKKAFR